MNIERGQFWRTRGGRKVEVLTTAIPGDGIRKILAMDCDSGTMYQYLEDGRYSQRAECDADLLAEWREPGAGNRVSTDNSVTKCNELGERYELEKR